MKIETAQEVKPTDEGIVLVDHGCEILITWEIIDRIANASEIHYQRQMIVDFMSMSKHRSN